MSISNFGQFFGIMLQNIASFLMYEPIIYFVGLCMLAFIIMIVRRIIHISM